MKEKLPLFAGVRALMAKRHEETPLRPRRRHLGIRLLLLATFIVPLAMADLADSTTYTIQFIGVPANGILPTAGGFTYDPDTATFSSFLVIWDGITFDLTSAANAPDISGFPGAPHCLGGLTGGAASFALLTGSCESIGAFWGGDTQANHQANFEFSSFDPSNDSMILVRDHLDSGPALQGTGGSTDWAVTAVSTPAPAPPVPEPSAAILLLTTLSMAGLARRRKT